VGNKETDQSAYAIFLGYQDVSDSRSVALFNIYGGPLDGSTVTEKTLERLEIPIRQFHRKLSSIRKKSMQLKEINAIPLLLLVLYSYPTASA
jgi:hypothetical protein